MRASRLSSFRQLLAGLRVLPAVLKVDSEATVEIGTARISFVSLANIGYLGAFNLHHDSISKFSSKLARSRGSARYTSSSDLKGSVFFLTFKNFFKPALVLLIVLEALDLDLQDK